MVHGVLELVVGAEGDEAAPRHAQREEHLLGRVAPHRPVQHLPPPRHEEEPESSAIISLVGMPISMHRQGSPKEPVLHRLREFSNQGHAEVVGKSVSFGAPLYTHIGVCMYLLESLDGAVEEERPDEQDDEDDVGEGGREVDDLPARLDPLRQAREHDDPRQQHAQTAQVV